GSIKAICSPDEPRTPMPSSTLIRFLFPSFQIHSTTKALKRHSKYLSMVKCQLWRIDRRVPPQFSSVVSGDCSRLPCKKSTKNNADCVPARITTRIPKRSDLREARALDSGLFTQLTRCRRFQRFVSIHESAG